MSNDVLRRTLIAAGLCASAVCAVPAALATDVHGTLQGLDSLQPSAPPAVPGRRLFYWEEPNGAIDVRRPHASVQDDLAVVVAGPLPEAQTAVNLPVTGGRCRPNTAVVAPNAVLRLQNQDWMPHEFYATRAGQSEPIPAINPTVTQPRSDRSVQIPDAGTYEIRDRTQPLFRCWVVVGPGQGRILTPNPDGSYRTVVAADGDFTVRVYYEGRMLAEAPFHVAADHDIAVPAMNLAAAAAAQAGAGAGAAPGAPGAPAQPGGGTNAGAGAGAAAPENDRHHHHRGH